MRLYFPWRCRRDAPHRRYTNIFRSRGITLRHPPQSERVWILQPEHCPSSYATCRSARPTMFAVSTPYPSAIRPDHCGTRSADRDVTIVGQSGVVPGAAGSDASVSSFTNLSRPTKRVVAFSISPSQPTGHGGAAHRGSRRMCTPNAINWTRSVIRKAQQSVRLSSFTPWPTIWATS